jgi:hypothetical protein
MAYVTYLNAVTELRAVHSLDLRGASPADITLAQDLLLEATEQLATAALAEAGQYGPRSEKGIHFADVARSQQASAQRMRELAANGWRTSWTPWFARH